MASVKLSKLRDLHAHLTELLAEFDAPAKDDSDAPTPNNSDAGESWAQGGQDSAHRAPGNTARTIDQMITNVRSGVSRR